MKISARQYAQALYESTAGKSEAELKLVIDRLAELLLSRNELSKSKEIIKEFSKISDQQEGILRVDLRSFSALTDPAKKMLADYLLNILQKTGGQVEFEEKIQPELLGGFTAHCDSRLLDASLKTRLEDLKSHLSTI